MLRYRYVISGGQGGPYLAVMHFSNVLTDQTTVNAGATKVSGFWDAMKGFWDTGMSGSLQAGVDVIDPVTGDLIGQFSTGTSTHVGTLSPGGRLPPATQGIFRWNTGAFVGGRRIKGRTFFPGLNEAVNVDPGVPGGSWLLTTPPTAIGLLLAAGDPTFSVWHRPTPTAPGSVHVVTAGSVDTTKWAVLRSRRD